MSRRSNRHRRERRGARDRISSDPAPFDMTRARARWQGFLKTATARGSAEPLFASLVVAAFMVPWDPQDAHPPARAHDRAVAEIVWRTREQDRS